MSDRKIFNIRLTSAQCALLAAACKTEHAARLMTSRPDTDELDLLAGMFAHINDSDPEPALCDFADDAFGMGAS